MSQSEITCDFCGKSFNREIKAQNVSKKLKRKQYCNRSCTSKARLDNNPSLKLNIKYGSEVDQFSPFRNCLRSAKGRAKTKNREFNLTLQNLLDLYNSQQGLCQLSGIKMITVKKTSDKPSNRAFLMSLDRIDSTKGYTLDNVQWVCLIGQYAKNTFHNDDLSTFCNKYVEYNKNI